jgi:copper resistance protein C
VSGMRGLLAALTLVILLAAPAEAHTDLAETTPAAGTQVSVAPASVSLDFSTQLIPGVSTIAVLDGDGRNHVAAPVDELGSRVVVGVEDMRPGDYVVRYRVVGADGHPIEDGYTFGVAPGAATSRTGVGETGPLGTAGAGAGYPAMVGLAALGLVAARLRQRRTRPAKTP